MVGLSAAFALRRDGHDVIVLEAETVGSGASRGNAGWFTTAFGHADLARRSIAELHEMRRAGVEAELYDDAIPDVELHVDPLAFCRALADWLAAHGVEVREHAPVERLPEGDVVVAAGIRTRELVDVPLDGVKGYSVDVPLHDGVTTQYAHEHALAITVFPDRLRVAGFLEPSTLDAAPVREKARELVARAGEHLGVALSDPGGAGWAGLRPTTPDNRPIVERRSENVVVATGHGMLGVTLAPVTGSLVAGLMEPR